MTREEIIKLAREAGGCDIASHGWASWVGTQTTEFLERFAALVAAAERSECAKVADDHERQRCEAWKKVLTTGGEVPNASLSAVSAAIRARGQA